MLHVRMRDQACNAIANALSGVIGGIVRNADQNLAKA